MNYTKNNDDNQYTLGILKARAETRKNTPRVYDSERDGYYRDLRELNKEENLYNSNSNSYADIDVSFDHNSFQSEEKIN